MTETELTGAEAAELRRLLHRAADELDVTVPDPAVWSAPRTAAPSIRSTRSTPRARWLAAAAAVALIAGGTWLAVGNGGSEDITVGPASTSDTVDERPVPSGDGIWRLPTDAPAGSAVSDAATSSSWFGFQIAVDDPDAPTRWLAISSTSFGFGSSDGLTEAARGTLPDGATWVLYEPRPDSQTGATWLELTGPGSAGHLTLAAVDVDPQQLVDLATDINERAGNLTDVTAMDEALRSVPLPDGLVPAWNPEHIGLAGPSDTPTSLSMVLSAPDGGSQTGLSLQDVGVAPQVAALEWLLQMDADGQGHGSTPPRTVSRRDDLGAGTLVIESDGSTDLIVHTDDGVRIWAGDLTGGTRPPLGLTGLLDLVEHLRVMPESRARAELAALGVEVVDGTQRDEQRRDAADGAPSSTTVPGDVAPGPTTTVERPAG